MGLVTLGPPLAPDPPPARWAVRTECPTEAKWELIRSYAFGLDETMDTDTDASLYDRIYAVARQIPAGQVSTYGQIAAIVGRGCSPRQVGYAMAALKGDDRGVPWQRVINSQGKISLRHGGGGALQRQLLEAEGVKFDPQGRTDFDRFGWIGPDWEWLDANGFNPAPPLRKPGKEQTSGQQLTLF